MVAVGPLHLRLSSVPVAPHCNGSKQQVHATGDGQRGGVRGRFHGAGASTGPRLSDRELEGEFKRENPMGGLMTAAEVFEKARAAAVAATGPDERALQIDYPALKAKIQAALGGRKAALLHVNRFLPEGYEEQGRFNLLLLTGGEGVYDMGVCGSFFRCEVGVCRDV